MRQDIYPDKLILELRKNRDKNVWMRSYRSMLGESWIGACEPDGTLVGSGRMISIGVGGEAALAEGHTAQ